MSSRRSSFSLFCQVFGFVSAAILFGALMFPLVLTSIGYYQGNFNPMKKPVDNQGPVLYIVPSPDQTPSVPQGFHHRGQSVQLGENAD